MEGVCVALAGDIPSISAADCTMFKHLAIVYLPQSNYMLA